LASREAVLEAAEPKSSDRVGVFWALLLLSAQSKVELYQEEFYQDLKIRALT
jgi:segregation and condensation protein A